MRQRLRHLPVVLVASGCAAVLALVVGGLVAGPVGAFGTLAGVALVVVSYLWSTLAIALADSVNPRLVLPVGMLVYITKFSLFGVLMVALLDHGWAGVVPMAAGIVAGVIAWNGANIWWVTGPGRPEASREPG